MIDLHFVIISILFLATNAFWALMTNKLINKLMSRNYHEYQAAENLGNEQSKQEIKKQLVDMGIPVDDLQGLNGIAPF